jgi:2-dehydropantoate 2-reductase
VNIGIVGAGGIGSYYAGVFSRAGHDVRVLTRGDHLAAIRTRGLEVRTSAETFVAHPEATDSEDRLIGCDAVIVSVKSYSLPEVAPALVKAAASGAAIIPFLNGIDVAERLEALGVPRESIVGGFVRASLVRTAPGVVERRSPTDLAVVGEPDRVQRDRTTRFVAALNGAGATARESDDIEHDLWLKFAFIVPMSVVCGLARQPIGRLASSEAGRALVAKTLHEVVAVSGGALNEADEETVRSELLTLPAGLKPSFLLDLERGGPTELDLLAGTVSRLGRERGVSTPVHDLATTVFAAATR